MVASYGKALAHPIVFPRLLWRPLLNAVGVICRLGSRKGGCGVDLDEGCIMRVQDQGD